MSRTARIDHDVRTQCRELGVDLDLVAGCQSFRDCPHPAEWLVVFERPGISPQTICDHHRPAFVYLFSVDYEINLGWFRFVRI